MNAQGGVFIVLGIFLAIFIFIVSQFLLPFPYGLIGGGNWKYCTHNNFYYYCHTS
jgi:hypothetical protein